MNRDAEEVSRRLEEKGGVFDFCPTRQIPSLSKKSWD